MAEAGTKNSIKVSNQAHPSKRDDRHPLVSVVIPCYNAERYVADAIRSALSQTYPRVEVIVVDDGSTDGSLKVIQSFGSAIRWETGPNRNSCGARNRGVELANGELIQFLDADDWLCPRKLEIQVAAAIEHAPAIVYCDYELIDLEGNRRTVRQDPDASDPVVLWARTSSIPAALLHWKSLFLSVGGFRIDLPYADDNDLHLRLACAGATFYHLPEALCTWRHVPQSLNSNWRRVVDSSRLVYRPRFLDLKRSNRLTDQRARALGAAVARFAYYYLGLGKIAKAKVMFRRADRMHPEAIREATATLYPGRFDRAVFRLLGPVGGFRSLEIIKFPRGWAGDFRRRAWGGLRKMKPGNGCC